MTTHQLLRPTLLGLTAALVAATGSLLVPQAAQAAPPPTAPHRVVHDDTVGDVVVYRDGADVPSGRADHASADITRTVVDHRAHRLVVRATLADLRRRSGLRFMVVEVRTPARTYLATLDYGRTPTTPDRVDLTTFRGRDVPCSGTSWRARSRTDVVRLSIPRSCLQDPAWVKVGVGVGHSTRDFGRLFADDSRLEATLRPSHLATGPRQPHQVG